MYDLITAANCLKLLKSRDDITYSKSYFSQMVAEGKIPSHSKHGSPKKFYKYEEVKKSIEDSKDPTRDAQREANNSRKVEPTLMSTAGTYPSQADMTEDELDRRLEEIREKGELEEVKRATLAGIPEEMGDIKVPEEITIAGAKAEKEFWLGLKNKTQTLELLGQVVPIAHAKTVVEILFSPLNKYLDDLPINLKSHFPEIKNEVVEWLIKNINDQKVSIREYEWES